DGTCEEAPSMAPEPATPHEPYRIALLVPQFITEAVMRERLAELGGGAPRFNTELKSFEQDAEGVDATISTADGEEKIRVRYLVGADGGRSFVRHALGIGFPGKTLGVRAVVADVVLDGLGRDAWHRFNEG